MLSLAEIGIGIGQIHDALKNNSGDEDLQNSGSLVGIIARRNNVNEEDAELWDAAGGFLPGLLSGTFKPEGYADGFKRVAGIDGLGTAATNVETITAFADAYDGVMDATDFGREVYEYGTRVEAVSSLKAMPAVMGQYPAPFFNPAMLPGGANFTGTISFSFTAPSVELGSQKESKSNSQKSNQNNNQNNSFVIPRDNSFDGFDD